LATDFRSPFRVSLLAVLFFELLFIRRGDQFLNPQVWDEDGNVIIPSVIFEGARSLIEPFNGYLNSIARLISGISLALSFVHYPRISTILSWIFIVCVVLAISLSPIILRGGVMLAALTLLVPSDPEVFGLPLYTFWWAALLIFLAALWRPHRSGVVWRVVFVVVGGLSSPAIFLALPIFMTRAWLLRERQETTVTLIALACGIVQFFCVRLDREVTSSSDLIASIEHFTYILPKFVGDYLVGNLTSQTGAVATGAALGTVAVVAAALWLNNKNLTLYVACYLWLGSIALSLARVDVAVADASHAGPRYFFFPFVFEAWLLLQVALSARQRSLRTLAGAMLILAAANALPVLRRPHVDDLHWRENVAKCAAAPDHVVYVIPIQFNGDARLSWKLRLTGDQCRGQLSRSLLDRP